MRIATKALIADGFARLSLHASFTALMVLTFEGASGATDLGIVCAAMLLPSVGLTILSGRLLTRFSPLNTFRATVLARAALLAVTPLAADSLPLLALCAGAVGLLQQVLFSAKMTFDASVVSADERVRYNGKRALLNSLAVLGGPSAAGLLAGVGGGGAAVLLAAAAGLFSFLPLSRSASGALAAGQDRAPAADQEPGPLLPWLRRSGQLGVLVVAYAVLLAILAMEAPLVFPFVKEQYNGGPDVSGTLLGVCGLGSLVGALVMHRRNQPVAACALTVLLATDGVLLYLIAAAPAVWLLYLLFGLLGVLSTVTGVTVETQVQNRAPPRYHPTIFSAIALAGGAGGATLALAAAAFADVAGTARALRYCAGLEIGVGLAATAVALLLRPRLEGDT
jgi:hypothetical protein